MGVVALDKQKTKFFTVSADTTTDDLNRSGSDGTFNIYILDKLNNREFTVEMSLKEYNDKTINLILSAYQEKESFRELLFNLSNNNQLLQKRNFEFANQQYKNKLMLNNIQKINDKSSFKDYVNLRSGTDSFSKMNYEQMLSLLSKDYSQEQLSIASHLTEKEQESFLRWILRGLKPEFALKKVNVNIEVSKNINAKRLNHNH